MRMEFAIREFILGIFLGVIIGFILFLMAVVCYLKILRENENEQLSVTKEY